MKLFYPLEGCIVSVLFLFGGIVPLQAQDSLSYASLRDSSACITSHDTKNVDGSHHLRLSNIVVPTALTAASALCVHNGWLKKQRENVQGALSNKGKHKTEIDNYLQYSPMVAVYGLNMLGVKGKHSFANRTGILALSYATMGILVNGMKYTFKEKRPDSAARNSFPSGHTATAFMGGRIHASRIQRRVAMGCIIRLCHSCSHRLSKDIQRLPLPKRRSSRSLHRLYEYKVCLLAIS